MTDLKSCVDCSGKFCEWEEPGNPEFCPRAGLTEEMLQKVRARYMEEENNRAAVISAEVENEFYGKYTRVEEIIEFARRMGYQKIGIATCVGLLPESRTLTKILRKKGFSVYGVGCKVGSFHKTDIGVAEKDTENTGPVMCNPILQAEILNAQGTEFNIVMGLCVGHDSLFYKYSNALVTTLVTKDRVLAHNPVGALYQAGGYYKRLME